MANNRLTDSQVVGNGLSTASSRKQALDATAVLSAVSIPGDIEDNPAKPQRNRPWRHRMSFRKTLVLPAAMLLAASAASAQNESERNEIDVTARAAFEREVVQTALDGARLLVFAADARERSDALDVLVLARVRGSALAADQLAYVYATGSLGLPRDVETARSMYERAVAQELPRSLLDYGLVLYDGHLLPADVERGLTLIRRAAELGDSVARVFMIDRLERAGDSDSLAMAKAWRNVLGRGNNSLYEGTRGDPELRARNAAYGHYALATFYERGVLVGMDRERAAQWLARVEPERRAVAAAQVAYRYSSSLDVRVDQRLAARLLRAAIDSKDPGIINNYAWLLSTSIEMDIRDGATAVALMETMLAEHERNGAWVDTLAAAYAESGDFETALRFQEEALELFASDHPSYDGVLERLGLYAEGKTWRE